MNDQSNNPVALDTYTLAEPVELGDTTYSELTFRRLRVTDMEKAFHANSITMAIKLLAFSTRVPEGVIRRLSSEDFEGANDALANFQSNFPKTGES